MDPLCVRTVVEANDVLELLKRNKDLDYKLAYAIVILGTPEAIDEVLNLKRQFLQSVPIQVIESYLSYNFPLASCKSLSLDSLYNLLDSAYAVQVKT